MSRSLSVTILLVLRLLIIEPSCLFAQWRQIAQFPSEIDFVKFISPTTGFLGFGIAPGGRNGTCAIYKTSNGGEAWTKCTIPSGYTGAVTQILMTDEQLGWATVTPWNCSGNNGLWSTSDGGLSWKETGLVGLCSSINITRAGIILTDLTGRMHISTDGGSSFFNGSANWTDDAAFDDSLNGVISNFRDASWWVTSDGGLNWSAANLDVESWSVYPVVGTSTYYAAPEGWTNGTPWEPQVLRSSDGGLNWITVAKLPFVSAGHVTGIGEKILYLQSTYGGTGVYRSNDQGASWLPLGGPSTNGDIRFDIVDLGCGGIAVWAFDNKGALFEFIDSALSNTGSVAQSSSAITKTATPLNAVDIPVHIKLSQLPALDTMQITNISFSVSYSTDLLDMNPNRLSSQISPASGLKFNSASISKGSLLVQFDNPDSARFTNDLYVGDLFFTAYKGMTRSTLVQLDGVSITTPNRKYYYCTNVEGDYIARVNVEGSSVAKPDVLPEVSLNPNPVRAGSALSLRWNVRSPGPVTVSLFDLLGHEVVLPLRKEFVSEGEHQLAFPVPSSIVSGSYYLRFDMNGTVVTKKVVCSR